MDEVGLGTWAGPLVVCAFFVSDESWTYEGLNDSKEFKTAAQKKERSAIAKELMRLHPTAFEIVVGPVADIDAYGLDKTHRKAMDVALSRLMNRVGTPDRVIIDGNKYVIPGAEHRPKADKDFPCVSAASVIAKTFRDELMMEEALKYPQYGFDRHAGYGTKLHLDALVEHGMTPIHRRSFSPMNRMFG